MSTVGIANYELVEAGVNDESKAAKVQVEKPVKVSSIQSSMNLTWEKIHYAVSIKDPETKGAMKQKIILHSMSGKAIPGEILGIMGSSGAGKSTLLDVLACRLESNALFGNVLCNGSVVDKRSFRKETGYVMQNDALFPMLTVRETIRFAAYLRIANATRQEKNEIADKTITLLRLDDCADTIVGDNDNRGISGGQKRRVSIGVDIVHEPSVIFLDEPTSGLDSSTALSVVESLKQLCAKRNSTIVMTIHQPSARLFGLLDKILFLNHGRVTYFGPTSETINAVHAIYAEANLGNAPTGNAPELFLDITDQLEAEGRLELVTDKHRELETVQSALIANGVKAYVGKNIPVSIDSYANSLAGDTMILFERALLNILRTKEHFFARLGASVFFGVQMGTLFLFTNQNAQGIQFRAAYFAFTLAFYYWTSLEALPIFLAEREIFQREYSRGAYRAAAYTVSSSIVYFPFLFTLGLVYTAISWWLVGLPNQASIFFFQVLIVWLVTIAGHTFSTMISVLVPNPMAGQTAGSALFSVMFLYSGFFINSAQIPKYWIWLNYLSLFKWGYDSMITNAFRNYAYYDDSVFGQTTNQDVLSQYGESQTDKSTGVAVLIAFIVFFRIIFYYRLVTAFNGSRK